MLEIRDLNVHYGGIHALRGVNIDVQKGQIVSIIGSNGAGKSTLLNAISSVVKISSGTISYDGRDVPRVINKVVQNGIVQVPEGRLIFANLTVRDNLLMGAYLRNDKPQIERDLQNVYQLFPRLQERITQMAGTLSGGEQQMLAMGRGLMADPEIIMLDEPSLGLAPLLVKTIFDIIVDIQKMGKTILLVEQNAFKALSIADVAYVLEQGTIVKKGVAAELIKDPTIQESYLGKKKKD